MKIEEGQLRSDLKSFKKSNQKKYNGKRDKKSRENRMKIIQLVLAALFATAISAKLAAPKVGLKVNYFSNRNEKIIEKHNYVFRI